MSLQVERVNARHVGPFYFVPVSAEQFINNAAKHYPVTALREAIDVLSDTKGASLPLRKFQSRIKNAFIKGDKISTEDQKLFLSLIKAAS